MRKQRLWLHLIWLGVILFVGCDFQEQPAPEMIKIASGNVHGLYYPMGGTLARLINQEQVVHGLVATVHITKGSVANINGVLQGNYTIGLAQSDRQYQAVHGLAEWRQSGACQQLRAICALYPETLTLLAADDAHINSLMDLKGKRVNIGARGSGSHQNTLEVLNALGLDYHQQLQVQQLDISQAASKLQKYQLDALFYMCGHPNAAIKQAVLGRRRVHFVALRGLDQFLAKFPYYRPATIAIQQYPSVTNQKDVPTIGVQATLVTAAQVPAKTIYVITKTIFSHLATLAQEYPACQHLNPQQMLSGLSAPLHPGALQYYQEKKLLSK